MGRGHSGRGGGRGGRGGRTRGGSRGGGFRGGGSRGGGFRGGGGRGRGGFRRGGESNTISRKDAEHMDQFGEKHPSEDPQNFSPHMAKRGRFDDRNSRGRGRGNRGYHQSRIGVEADEGSSESEEESTPYDQLLAIYSNGKNLKKEVQIVSESETDDDENIDEKGTDDDHEQSVDDEQEDNTDIEEEQSIDGEEEQSIDDEEEKSFDEESEDSANEEYDDSGDSEDADDVEDIKDSKMKISGHKKLQSQFDGDEEDSHKSKTKGIKQGNAAEAGDSDNQIESDVNNEEEETVIEDAEIDPEFNDGISEGNVTDPFVLHFEAEINEAIQQELKNEKPYGTQISRDWPTIEKFQYSGLRSNFLATNHNLTKENLYLAESSNLRNLVKIEPPPIKPSKDNSLQALHVKTQLHANLSAVNQPIIDKESCSTPLSPLQAEVFSMLTHYHDLYYTQRNSQNSDALRIAYCLHAANHIWKTRNRIIHHNAKMANKVDVPDDFRDQSFVRPKVLILAPFKDSALKIIQTLVSIILSDQKGMVANKNRFNDEYGGTTLFLPKTNPKPDDYGDIFGGNCDDNYKIGLAITKKSVKLYTGFYSSDIIVASPLGLRMIIGAEGEKDRDYDFLSSIELLIMDQSDIFLMQNWDHVLHIMKHLHLQPITTHGTDFARIRPWAVDGLTKYYCQTVILSSFMCPEHNALFSRYCRNYSGCVKVVNPVSVGSICRVTVQLPQVFQQFDCDSLQTMDDDRFKFFLDKVLPNFKDRLMSHTLIFVSSYFDFVRLRNHFKREEVSFVQICEYTKDKKIARARDLFYHNQNHFMVYTERAHFFRRFRLKGIGHIIFYQLPQYPHFYSELCDYIQEGFQNRRVRLRKNSSVNVIYCKFDAPRLSAVVGTERAAHMITSGKKVHAFVSGEL